MLDSCMSASRARPALKCVISVMAVGCIHLVIFRYCYKAHSRHGRRYGLISQYVIKSQVPEIIDPVFAKTSQYARFLLGENERFGLVFVKTGYINSAKGIDSGGAGTLNRVIVLACQATKAGRINSWAP